MVNSLADISFLLKTRIWNYPKCLYNTLKYGILMLSQTPTNRFEGDNVVNPCNIYNSLTASCVRWYGPDSTTNMRRSSSWWRHQMETFSALLAICAGNSPLNGEFPAQRPVTRSFDVFFDLRLNKRLSKQSWGWWFETLSRLLWRHCNVSCTKIAALTLGWFGMPETCENWLGLVNRCVYYVRGALKSTE